jgi:dTDP-4-dehydrorhamnose 3,5-epimerase
LKIEQVTDLPLPGVKLIHFGRYDDDRGHFCEPYRESQLAEVIPGFRCVQVNQSHSHVGVIRGLHIQTDPPMGKLVRVLNGAMWDLCLDLRRDSPAFGNAVSVLMYATNGAWIWVPPGIAHGNYFPTDTTIEYLCTAEYNHAGESGVCPFATDISWIGGDEIFPPGAMISDKDRNAPTLTQWLEAHP